MSEWIRTGSVPLSLKSSLDGNFPGLSLKKRRSCPWQFHSPQLTSGSALLDLINRDLSVHRKSARSSLQECKQCYKRWNGLFHSNSKEALKPLHSPWWRCPHRSEIDHAICNGGQTRKKVDVPEHNYQSILWTSHTFGIPQGDFRPYWPLFSIPIQQAPWDVLSKFIELYIFC